jgi:hypothetical protein
MTFRERVRRVFRSKSDEGRPKVEYYRRHECPPSKFKGPFDRDHQKRLAAWSFDGAMVEKTRSFDSSVSPFATYGSPASPNSDDSVSPDDSAIDPGTHSNSISYSYPYVCMGLEELLSNYSTIQISFTNSPLAFEPESSPRAVDSGSQSSTILNPSSYSGSMRTLLNETSIYEIPEDKKDPKFYLKESVRYTSPCILSARKQVPFNPEDLTRALIAVQVCA